MKPDAFILSIPNPCSENWEEMATCPSGKFCAHCQHEVVDFTTFTDTAIAQYLESNTDENVCGRFYRHQLQEKEFSCRPPLQVPYKALLLAASVAALNVVNIEAQAQSPRQGSHVFPTVKQPTLTSPITEADTLIIRGEVRNTRNEEVINSTVILWQQREMLGGTVSDFEGKYELRIPVRQLTGTPLLLTCTHFHTKVELPIQPDAKGIVEQSFLIDAYRINTDDREYIVGRLKKKKKKWRW